MEMNFDNFDNDEVDNIFELKETKITMRIDKRNGKKCTTNLENLNMTEEDMKKHLKILKSKLGCNGCVKNNNNELNFQLQGNKRDQLIKYLIDNKIAEEKNITIIG